MQSVKTQILLKIKVMILAKKTEIKRHIAVDSQGLSLAIYITTAEKTDRNSAIIMIQNEQENLSTVQKIINIINLYIKIILIC